MKGILCLECVDFKALHPDEGVTVTCMCGNVTGTWTNSSRGYAKVKARHKDTARAVGIHNGFLALSMSAKSDSEWKRKTQLLLDTSNGYLFHTDRRNCPFLIIRIGESNDVVWNKLELFARQELTNWKSLGNALDGVDIKDSLLSLST